MGQYYSTYRQGKVKSISKYEYKFKNHFLNDIQKQKKHLRYLRSKWNAILFDHSDDYFYSFIPLEKDDKIYSLESKITTHPPFDNLNQLSGYLSLLMCEYLESKSKRFLNNNIFVLDHKTEYLFMRLECIEVKFETFPSGDFYIFFIISSFNTLA